MKLSKLKPRKALNKAFLKVKPNRSEIERFKTELIQLLDRANDIESEEFHKNLVIDFLKKQLQPNGFINILVDNSKTLHIEFQTINLSIEFLANHKLCERATSGQTQYDR